MALYAAVGNQTGVGHQRNEFRDMALDYRLIQDCLSGQRHVKQRGVVYLPKPDAQDESEANIQRYDDLLERALFYNVTQSTLSGLVGEVFARDPVAELPISFDVMLEDANGGNLTLIQLAKRATRYVLGKGRAGMLADYPQTDGGVSADDVGKVKPTITVYETENIINWRVDNEMSDGKLVMVVLCEQYDDGSDEFVIKPKTQHRVLRLTGGVYTTQIYRKGEDAHEVITPKDHAGNPFARIPFTFIGSENNDADIDHPPMLSLAYVNIAHYRNSASYEEGVYMIGQPTLVLSGLTKEWVEKVLNGGVRIGSRGAVMMPDGGDAHLISMEANGAAHEAMEQKERQMVALGGKLVEQKQVQRTATEAGNDNASETSVLSSVVNNVTSAIEYILKQCAMFTVGEVELTYKLNTEFSIASMTAQERQQLIAEWQTGGISFSEMRAALRKSGIATLDDAEAKTEIDAEDFRNEEDEPPASGGEE